MARLLGLLAMCLALAACSASPDSGGVGDGNGDGDGDDMNGLDAGDGMSGQDASSPRDASIPPRRDATCESIRVAAEPGGANVLIVLDRSNSMYGLDSTTGRFVDRWNPAVAAINATTAALDDRIDFGLMLFGSSDLCAVGEVKVPCGPMNASAIASELSGSPSSIVMGGTPTAESLRAARSHLASLEGDSYVLLVTDGAPNCRSGVTPCDRCTGTNCGIEPLNCLDLQAITAVEELADAGIGTYVIGYDVAGWADVLDAMAAAGGTGRTSHFPVEDQASLTDALRDIGGSIASCSYELEMVPPSDYRYIRVTVDGTTIQHESVMNDGNGWILEGDRTITLVGDACEALKDGEAHDINIVVECEPVLI